MKMIPFFSDPQKLNERELMASQKWETIGRIGVDSGTIMFIDPCYLVPGEDWSNFCAEYEKKEVGRSAILRGGVAITTPHGDGTYAVKARYNKRGQIVEIRMNFEWDNEDY